MPGVTLTKWRRTWAERFPRLTLEVVAVAEADQRGTLDAGLVDVCFVRLPVDTEGLHRIPLYEEVANFSPNNAPQLVDGPQPRELLDRAVMGAQADAARFSAEAAQLPQAENPVAAAQDLAGRAGAAAQQHAGDVRGAVDAFLR